MSLRIFTGEDLPTDDPPSLAGPESQSDTHFLGQYIPLHYHYNMLQDEERVGAFREAIQLCVKPGMKVVELGGGTGILSYLAACKGARVTCVERNPQLTDNAKRFLADNGMDDLVEVITADACDFIPQEPVDVVICEMLHVALLREKQLEVIEAFKAHHQATFPTAPLPRFLPEASLLMVQPVEQSFHFAGYWAPVPLFHAASQKNERTQALGDMSTYSTILYDEPFAKEFQWSGQLAIQHPGRLTALRFITQNALAIDTAGQRSINWPNQCLVLPIEEPIDVTTGQSLEVKFAYSAGDSIDALSQSLSICLAEAVNLPTPQTSRVSSDAA